MPRRPLLIAVMLLALPAGLSAANGFETSYDPFKNLRTVQISPADPDDALQVQEGAALYAEHCAACHGAALEGAENWRERDENNAYKPPPHDDSGHTWHHSDKVLFEYIKFGGEKMFEDYPDIVSDMPGFEELLSNREIWAVLAFIKSSWSKKMRAAQKTASEYDPLPDAHLPEQGDARAPQ